MQKYETYWVDDGQTAIIIEFKEDITWDDFHPIVDEAHALAKQVPHEVALIMWYQTSNLPKGNPMTHFRSVANRQPANLKRVIIINPNMETGLGKYVKLLAKMLQRFVPQTQNITFVTTYEDAIRALTHTSNETSS